MALLSLQLSDVRNCGLITVCLEGTWVLWYSMVNILLSSHHRMNYCLGKSSIYCLKPECNASLILTFWSLTSAFLPFTRRLSWRLTDHHTHCAFLCGGPDIRLHILRSGQPAKSSEQTGHFQLLYQRWNQPDRGFPCWNWHPGNWFLGHNVFGTCDEWDIVG